MSSQNQGLNRADTAVSDMEDDTFGGESHPQVRSGVTRAGGTQVRAANTQSRIAPLAAKPRIKMASFTAYKPAGVLVAYADNKVGVMPNIESVISAIAAEAGIDPSVEDQIGGLLDALVTDVYVNPYSDKQTFEGEIVVRGGLFSLSRRHIMAVLTPIVGTAYRRYARALAPTVVAVMHDNPDFAELLDKRCTEVNLSTRAEAVYSFDGADALINVDRSAAQRNAAVKAISLTRHDTGREYTLSNSAISEGIRDRGGSMDNT